MPKIEAVRNELLHIPRIVHLWSDRQRPLCIDALECSERFEHALKPYSAMFGIKALLQMFIFHRQCDPKSGCLVMLELPKLDSVWHATLQSCLDT